MLFFFIYLGPCISLFSSFLHFPFWRPPSPSIILSFPFRLFFYWLPTFPPLPQMISPRTKRLLGHATITCIQIENKLKRNKLLLCCCTQNLMFTKKPFSSTNIKSCSKLPTLPSPPISSFLLWIQKSPTYSSFFPTKTFLLKKIGFPFLLLKPQKT